MTIVTFHLHISPIVEFLNVYWVVDRNLEFFLQAYCKCQWERALKGVAVYLHVNEYESGSHGTTKMATCMQMNVIKVIQ